MTTETLTLTEFLTARIGEDEAVARAASPGPWHLNAERDEVLAVDDITVCDGFALSGPQTRATTEHIARHDPARVLAECEAKRRIVEQLERNVRDVPRGWIDRILQHLAAVYADHPDYNPDWRALYRTGAV